MAVLLTGANGFLGAYIKSALQGQALTTLGLKGCDYNVDLSVKVPEFRKPFNKVIHAAGMAHMVPRSSGEEQRFFDVNVTGTLNLLKGLENLPALPEIYIYISTVAVYGADSGECIDETAPVRGSSPYARSKAEAEVEVEKWGAMNNVEVLILRLPLIAGKNPPGNLGAMVRAIKKGYYFRIGDGSARRSMVLADDVAEFISTYKGPSGTFNLTDGCHPTIRDLDEAIASKLGRRIKALPRSVVRIAACAGDIFPFLPLNTLKLCKLTSSLTFSDAKARAELAWSPRAVVDHLEI